MSPRKAGREDVAAAKRAVKDAKAAAKAADREAKAAAKRARKSKRVASPGRQGGRYVPIEKRLKNQQRERAAVEGPPRSQGRLQAHRLRRPVRRRHRAGGAGAVQSDGQLRRHQLPEHGRRVAEVGVSPDAEALRRPDAGRGAAASAVQPPAHQGRDVEPQVLRPRGGARRSLRRRVQPHPQRQDGRGRVQHHARALPDVLRLRRHGGGVRAQAGAPAFHGGRRAFGHAQRHPRAAGRGTPAADTVDDAAGARARRVRLRRPGRHPRDHGKGPGVPRHHGVQARRLRQLLHQRRRVVPGAGVPQLREQPDRPLPGGHGGPSHAVGHQLPREGHEPALVQGLRPPPLEVDRQGDVRGPDGRREQGLRLQPHPQRAEVHPRGGPGRLRVPEGRQPADVPLHGAGVHLRPHPRRAGRAGDAPDIGGAGAGHRAREPGLPAARGAELRAAAGAQPREGGALDAHRRDSHPVPLRHLGAERLRGRLLWAEQGQPQPGDAQPQGPGQPKRHHKRHAGQRQVLRRQARDDQHGAALPRGRCRHHRPRRRVRPAGRGLRRPQRGVRPGLRDISEPARPKRRLRAFGDDTACL